MKSTLKSKINSFFSKYALKILLGIFFFPFAGVFLGDITGKYLIPLYTFGIPDLKGFYTFWIALFGAIGIAYNIYQNQKRIYHQEKQLVNQNEQLEKQQQQIDLQKKVERDNRFVKGLELLGNKNEVTRSGAVYNLYFLAKEFPEDYKLPVFDLLCTLIRIITSDEDYKKDHLKQPSYEIQTLINLLFKPQNKISTFIGEKAYLANTFLVGINLDGANLDGINLEGANLAEAHLDKTSTLKDAKLRDIILEKADLSGAILTGANLYQANLIDAKLTGAYLHHACLEKADLTCANLKGIQADYVDLRQATLWGANLSNADLTDAILCGADLLLTDLREAKLDCANLRGAAIEQAIR